MSLTNIRISGHSEQRHPVGVRAHPAPGPQSRDGQPHVRALHQGQGHSHEHHAQVQEEMRHHHRV